MSLDTAAGANALLTVLAGLSGIGGAQLGVPLESGKLLYGTVTAASQVYQKVTLGQNKGRTSRDARYMLSLSYRLDGHEAAAELALMGLLDELAVALHIGYETGAGQVVAFDTGLADTPEYQVRSGKEYREYPVLVTLRQYDVPG